MTSTVNSDKPIDGRLPATPILFPYEPEQFWSQVRTIVREEIQRLDAQKPDKNIKYIVPGLEYKPLYKLAEVCAIFQVTKPTIYDWINHGKLKPYKIRSRVYFLWNDIQQLLQPTSQQPI